MSLGEVREVPGDIYAYLQPDGRWLGTPAHTTNDSIVPIPERSVVCTGDLDLATALGAMVAYNGGRPHGSPRMT